MCSVLAYLAGLISSYTALSHFCTITLPIHRFETAALLTVAQQRNSKTYYDGLLAWAIEVVSKRMNVFATLCYSIQQHLRTALI